MVQSLDDVRRSSRASAQRVPPHNLQAEQSLLGAMLLSRDAIAAAVESCGVNDFYKPAHGHIFEAVTSLYGQGEPADPVTVADELSRAGLLEAVGGLQTLLALQADTPATANAGRYGRIVEEHALLRRLIGVAGDIAEMGYDVPDDVAAVLDRAETLMFEVAERRVTDTLRPLDALLAESLDRLEALYARGEAITGVPTGYADLDERLSGLQPSALLIVGARPAMGKALALDTPIPTPDGWTTMGALTPGSCVLDEQGQPRTVTYTSPVYEDRRCYRVAFDDGSTIVADAEHQWFAYDLPAWRSARERHRRAQLGPAAHPDLARAQEDRRRHPRVVTTEEMLEEGVRSADGSRPNWYLPLTAPLDLPERELPVDPYILGCWLGHGTPPSDDPATPELSNSTAMTIGDLDAEHFRDEFEAAGYRLTHRHDRQYATVPVAGSGAWQGYDGPLRVLTRELLEVGLLGGRPKHLPAAYLRGSAKQRLALLQGLMDADAEEGQLGGVANGNGTVEICLANEVLLRQVRELVCSLGHKPGPVRKRTVTLPHGRERPAWRVAWTPLDPVFRLPRKADRLARTVSTRPFGKMARRAITSIEPVATVPVRCITVDGPSHLYLAGPSLIPTHNTAFALGMAANAAMRSQVPVLVFSLEMSHSEITQRLLVSEARVDANRIRNGKLTESDWPKIHQAVARLGEAPIHVDDDPNLTVMELRAKARRHKSRHGGLGLIIVDYLQLMSGRSSAENRQVEVSEISRGLKILARELQVPVVALSQLSRNLEQRADKRPQLADLRESGCMPASTRLRRADDGSEVTLGELVLSQEQPLVWSLDEQWRMVPRRLVKTFPSGIKPVFRLRTASGWEVEATANHPFRTLHGWTGLDELAVGDALATPRQVAPPLQPTTGWDDDEVILLAHLLGDGSMGPSVTYATADPANLEAVRGAAKRLFGIELSATKQVNTWQAWLPSPYRLTHGRCHPVKGWLEPLGLWSSRSHNTFLPEALHGLDDRQLALFLHHLWATDGSLTLGRNGRGPVVRCYYATTSLQLAEGVRRALLRFGIQTRLKPGRKEGYRTCWQVIISGCESQRRFLTDIGCHGARGAAIPDALAIVNAQVANPDVDLLPREASDLVRSELERTGTTHRALAEAIGEDYCDTYLLGDDSRPRRLSRRRLAAMADALGSEQLSDLATSDVFWDPIVEITPLGPMPTFDATVEDTHNFVANGIVAHNSLEQDADVVMFLYRDEIYDKESQDRGTAEVIVAKHRNGPTGSMKLAFLDHYTRFENMARI